ncbi:hypothetical protein [Floridanema aerugineum]|uniref:Uncharacterized protein n=1 Tax=Floridaenema aerugineum BLCC-F46 TaxID=3153654 RepID=A0ABV4X6X0_9CYAN
MSNKVKYLLLGLLVIGIATWFSHSYNFAMMGLTTFLIAYLSKGMRRYRAHNPHSQDE